MTEAHPDGLLPWYVNGSLSAAEQQQVDAHLAHCERCRSEVDFLQAIRAEAKQLPETIPADFAWYRLRRDLQAEPAPATRRNPPWWLPSLAGAAVLTLVVHAGLLLTGAPAPGYGLAGGTDAGALVQVRFRPDATEREIRAALGAVGGDIVMGPGARGVYRIRLADSDADPEWPARIEALRANRDVIDFIERD